jgi:chlorobactene glucosyltransferase
LIPARNEEANIEKCINSIDISNTLIKEIIVLDDDSKDNTWEILKKMSSSKIKLSAVKGKKKPEGWSGKSFACYQLSKYASSDWILFIDADTELEKGGADKIIGYAQKNNYSMVSAWPKIEMKSAPEKVLMPLLNFLVFSSFPTTYSLKSKISSLGLAHGACILFNKKTYEFLGGHKLVKDSLFEDTELAKKWRLKDEMSVCINGVNIIRVRMYDSFKNIWLGFEKNSYPAFKNNFYFFIFHIFNFIFFSLPIIFIPLHILKINENIYLFLSGLLIQLLRLGFSLKFKHPLWSSIFHLFSEIIFLLISLSSFIKYNFLGGIKWKSRKYGR